MVTYRELLTRAARNSNDGRGATAIVAQLRSQGVKITPEEGAGLVSSYFQIYPRTQEFLTACKEAVVDKGYVQSAFGRYRRFPDYKAHCRDYYAQQKKTYLSFAGYQFLNPGCTYGEYSRTPYPLMYSKYLREEVQQEVAKYGREACNAPIQSAVADSVNMALRNLLQYRKDHPALDFKLHMQIHDALVVSVPREQVEQMLEVMQLCMVTNNPMCVLDPRTNTMVEHRFAIDSDLYYHWGEPITLEQIKEDMNK